MMGKGITARTQWEMKCGVGKQDQGSLAFCALGGLGIWFGLFYFSSFGAALVVDLLVVWTFFGLDRSLWLLVFRAELWF